MLKLFGMVILVVIAAMIVWLNVSEAKRRAKLTPEARKAEDDEASKPVSGF